MDKVIDLIALDEAKNEVNLIIMDDLRWDDLETHLDYLQNKIMAYVTYVDEGHLKAAYPDRVFSAIAIHIVCENEIPDRGFDFVEQAKASLMETGFVLRMTHFK